MAVRNEERYVADALASIFAQSLSDFEVIVVDDASTDETPVIVAGVREGRIRVLRNERRLGIPASLNRALALARGRYVARHDGDDLSEPTRFERQIELLEARPDGVLCGTWARLIDAAGRTVGTARPPARSDELVPALREENRLVHGTVVFRRQPVVELGAYREAFALAQDYDLYLRLSERHALVNVPQELYRLRLHSDAVTLRETERQHHFALLARELAEERARRGRDAVEDGRPVESLLREVAGRHPSDGYQATRASYCWRLGDLRGYRRAVLGLLTCDPWRYDNWLRLVASLLGRRAAESVERLFPRRLRAEWAAPAARESAAAR